jgi:Raf kinase inhibitor-like YbhB/YbcL family protein
MNLASSSFANGGEIPKKFTCEGRNISPQLSWTDVPRHTESFALIVCDADAPGIDGFPHWIVFNIPATVRRIEEDAPPLHSLPGIGLHGAHAKGTLGYIGPCPPSGRHRYTFRLFALRRQLYLEPGATCEQVISAMEGQILEQAELVGTYEKASPGSRSRS